MCYYFSVADVMANQSESSVEELVSVDECDVPATPEAGNNHFFRYVITFVIRFDIKFI